ncbi:MAG: hypothetical protein ACI8RZ_000927 [Myxococcota bacterium]|jgi:hypothetical protein
MLHSDTMHAVQTAWTDPDRNQWPVGTLTALPMVSA